MRFGRGRRLGWPAWDDSHPVRIFRRGRALRRERPARRRVRPVGGRRRRRTRQRSRSRARRARSGAVELRSVVRRLRRTGDVPKSS
ncbi:hypothetical protein ACRAWF_47285 [Streptomyces sp. L7]